MKICMLGTGSLGSTIGGTLAQGGSEVYFVRSVERTYRPIRENGLRMTDEKEEWTVPAWTPEHPLKISGPVDLVIVLVKSFATREAVAQLKETNVIGENTLVMSLQNGLETRKRSLRSSGEKNVISGKTYVGGRLIEPGYVSAGVKGKDTYIGELTGEITERIQKVADEFNRAGASL